MVAVNSTIWLLLGSMGVSTVHSSVLCLQFMGVIPKVCIETELKQVLKGMSRLL